MNEGNGGEDWRKSGEQRNLPWTRIVTICFSGNIFLRFHDDQLPNSSTAFRFCKRQSSEYTYASSLLYNLKRKHRERSKSFRNKHFGSENESNPILFVLFWRSVILKTEVAVQIHVDRLGRGRRCEILPWSPWVPIVRFLDYLVSQFLPLVHNPSPLAGFRKFWLASGTPLRLATHPSPVPSRGMHF